MKLTYNGSRLGICSSLVGGALGNRTSRYKSIDANLCPNKRSNGVDGAASKKISCGALYAATI